MNLFRKLTWMLYRRDRFTAAALTRLAEAHEWYLRRRAWQNIGFLDRRLAEMERSAPSTEKLFVLGRAILAPKVLYLLFTMVRLTHGAPVSIYAPVNFSLFPPGSVISEPGMLLDHPSLYTFAHAGAPNPDYSHCGQRGFIPTFEDGRPDPNGVPGFMQINTPCSQPTFESLHDEHHEHEHHEPPTTHMPEPSTLALAGFGALAILVGSFRRAR